MRCLYCGKEIGTFRLLRDSEFCSALHRKKYGERLGKALHEIAAPEPAPAGVAGFRVQMPVQPGNLTSTLVLWQSIASRNRIRISKQWPLTIDTSDPISEPAPVPQRAAIDFPPRSERWMAEPPAELVAAFVQASANPAPACQKRTPRFAAELEPALFVDAARHAPAPDYNWMPAPAPELVAAFVQASANPTPVYQKRTLRFAAELKPALFVDASRHAPAYDYNWMPAPAPEPVAAFVEASASPAAGYRSRGPRFTSGLTLVPSVDAARHAPARDYNWMSAPAPEPVAAFVEASASFATVQALHLPHFAAEVEPTPFLDAELATPPLCERWMSAPAPEPVAAFVQAAAALAPVQSPLLPSFAAEWELSAILEMDFGTPAACQRWIAGPPPEAVAAFVQSSTALARVYALHLPRLAAELEPVPCLDLALFAPVPPAEVVAAFVQPAAALYPAFTRQALCLQTGPETALQVAHPSASDAWMPDSASCGLPEHVAAYSLSMDPAGVPPRMPAPEFTADLDPLPVPDDPLEIPALCEQWMPAPAADPVFSYLQASVAPGVSLTAEWNAPVFAMALAATYVPWIPRTRRVPQAEPVMAAIQPSAAKAPQILIPLEVPVALPAVPQVAQELIEAASPAAPDAPEAVESWLIAAQSTVPISSERTPYHSVERAEPSATFEPAPTLGGPATGPVPAALESFLIASMAAHLTPVVRLPQFALSATQQRAVQAGSAQSMEPAAGRPLAAASRFVAPQPIATVAVAPPSLAAMSLESGLPHPGLLPIEFHAHRGRSAAAGRPEWQSPRPALVPPRFLLRTIPEKLENPVAPEKTTRKKPVVVEIPNMPTAKRPPTVLMVAGKVAAGFLLAASLWFGMANFRGDHRLAAREASPGDAALSTAISESAPGLPGSGSSAQPQSKGAVAWVKQTIARRAALKIPENFHDMENWDGAAKTRPAGWSHHPDGYMNTGALALFRPTLKFNDYRMEFFGQIETKSIGWTVRAADSKNYHAMKLTVIEAGIRPFVALVHYDVVDGKSGHRTQTPLNVMVHNNTPIQFAVDVRGNRFVTSIDGEEVDSFIEDKLVAGGVGFFSEAGERARLYWMRVSRNDDFLGHICAMLADGTSAATAELRKPELPGGVPPPGMPGERDGKTLAALWIGLPYLGATRKTRLLKNWRCEPWNT